MFAVKPSSAKEEFEQLHKLLGTAAVAEVLDKRPESVSRLKKRARYTRPLERLIDDVWTVVHVATTRAHWREDQVRAFLLLRQPHLGLKPAAELIRAGRTEAVLEAIPTAPQLTGRHREHATHPPRRRRPPVDPAARAAAQRRLAERGLKGLDRERLAAAGHEAWGTAGNDS
ncbi:MAG: hypothetical protein MSC31_03245 [Solirubrobacteraceae bacterium MAG38_C4-C5]|nr:hypothetical protein [Candidatus Siliceabacter maunaloa]